MEKYILIAMLMNIILLLLIWMRLQVLHKKVQRQEQDTSLLLEEEFKKVGLDTNAVSNLLANNEFLQRSLMLGFKDIREETLHTIRQSIQDQNELLHRDAMAKNQMLHQEALENEKRLENIRQTVERQLNHIKEDNHKNIEGIRNLVDEKLQVTLENRISESFQLVNERLEQVYKGLGEMQNLAVGVGDLKKVLSNVKTRGVMGELQLGAILEEILSPEQYDENVATKRGSQNHVEYAVKLPGNGHFVYLPIDAKFPADAYSKLLDAYEEGDKQQTQQVKTELANRIRGFAKDIAEKYVDVPYTTEFAVMFLPFEGLYCEVVNLGLFEELQRKYKITITGPTTMAALLNSLQMGFRTLAIQKKSSEVWEILGAVKNEFEQFEKVLEAAQKKIESANSELDKLIGVRTRQIRRKLKDIQTVELDLFAGEELEEDLREEE